jgi:hypothetical protein
MEISTEKFECLKILDADFTGEIQNQKQNIFGQSHLFVNLKKLILYYMIPRSYFSSKRKSMTS